jgi:hypothetical protein
MERPAPRCGRIATDAVRVARYGRVLLASNRGTLMELGISPIITSGDATARARSPGAARASRADAPTRRRAPSTPFA